MPGSRRRPSHRSSCPGSATSTLGRIFPSLDVAVDTSLAGSGSIIHANGNIGYAPVNLGATTSYYGFYAVDALDLTDALTVTAGLRVNAADINTRDRSGLATFLHASRKPPVGCRRWAR